MRYRSSRYPERRSPLLPLALVVLVALGVGFAGGVLLSGDDGGTAVTSPTVRASGSGAAQLPGSPTTATTSSPVASGPPPVVARPDDVLPPGAAARVAVEVLRIRESPATDARLLDQLAAGQLVLIGPAAVPDGPISGGGFAWYPVQRLGDLTELPALPGEVPTDGVVGWAAAGDAEVAYLELVPERCPARPASLATVAAMLPWERLACFGSESLALDGVMGCPGCGGAAAGTFEPAWLAAPTGGIPISVDPATRIGPLAALLKPEGPAPPANGSIVRVTAHFDDPAAAGCVVAPGDPPEPIDSRTAALYCRERMVVDTLEVTGTDPGFPTG
ncbi:MAG: hypothetical protein ABI622_07975 [Chloroflexota bacterium]